MAAKIGYVVRQFIDLKQAKIDASISAADVNGAQIEQSSLMVHYGELAAQCSRQVDDLELLIKVAEAKVYRKLRDQAASEGEKVTEVLLGKMIDADANIISLRRALNEAKQIEANSKTVLKAFEQRRDMLVQQGATLREERKGEVRTMAREAGEEIRQRTEASVTDKLARFGN